MTRRHTHIPMRGTAVRILSAITPRRAAATGFTLITLVAGAAPAIATFTASTAPAVTASAPGMHYEACPTMHYEGCT